MLVFTQPSIPIPVYLTMRIALCILFALGVWTTGAGQTNLVPNGSFEAYSMCPTGNELNNGQFTRCNGWWYPTDYQIGTPDYFNACNNSINGVVGVPQNFHGFQQAYEGQAYVGGVVSICKLNSQFCGSELIATRLISPLKACHEYRVSFRFNLSNETHYSFSRVGAKCSVDSFHFMTGGEIDAITPDFEHQTFITDTLGWTTISGQVHATGGERYLTLGYFHDNITNDSMYFQFTNVFETELFMTYYIDSVNLVEVGPSALPCPPTAADTFALSFPTVFTPNNDDVNRLFLPTYSGISEFYLRIFNRWGQEIFETNLPGRGWDGYTFGGKKCPDGTYYYVATYVDINGETGVRKGHVTLLR